PGGFGAQAELSCGPRWFVRGNSGLCRGGWLDADIALVQHFAAAHVDELQPHVGRTVKPRRGDAGNDADNVAPENVLVRTDRFDRDILARVGRADRDGVNRRLALARLLDQPLHRRGAALAAIAEHDDARET